MEEAADVRGGSEVCTTCGHFSCRWIKCFRRTDRRMDRWHTDSSDSVTNQTGRKVQINLGEIQRTVGGGWISGTRFLWDEWTDDRWREMRANAFWQQPSRGYRQGQCFMGTRCIANVAKWRSLADSQRNEITASNEAGLIIIIIYNHTSLFP